MPRAPFPCAIASIVLAALAPSAAHAAPDAFDAQMAAGRRAEANAGFSDWTVATAHFRRAVALRPDDAVALAELTWCAVNAGDLDGLAAIGVRAVKAARAAKNKRLEAMALYDLGMVELGVDARTARALFQASIALRPDPTVAAALAAADARAAGTRAGAAIVARLGLARAKVETRPVPAAEMQALALDATATAVTPGAPCADGYLCQTDDVVIAGRHVAIVEVDSGNDGEVVVELGAQGYAVAGLTLAEAHMSEYREVDHRERVTATAGTLADGNDAAVIVLNIGTRAYHDQSDETISIGHRARVMACALRTANCTAAVDATCGAGGCTATLTSGVLTVLGTARATYLVAP
jgi:hypothetical protein